MGMTVFSFVVRVVEHVLSNSGVDGDVDGGHKSIAEVVDVIR